MRTRIRSSPGSGWKRLFFLSIWFVFDFIQPLLSSEIEPATDLPSLISPSFDDRLLSLERQCSSLAVENQRLAQQVNELQQAVPFVNPSVPPSQGSENAAHQVGYDNGLFIASTDANQFPFQLKFNNQAQIRYTAFEPGLSTWTDGTGKVTPITKRSAFEVTRGRAIFSGYAFDPNLKYNLTIDYTTVSDSQINFWNYWLSYQFSRRFSLFIGQGQVPGSREWLTPFLYLMGPDYSLATTFFRPSLSQGIWAAGELNEWIRYRTMLSNGFNTLGSSPQQLDSRMTLSGSMCAEPLGDFGVGFSDFESHLSPVIRMGTSFTISPNRGQQGNPNLPENNDIRLTNGTLLTQTGALAPGVTLNQYTITLGAFDFGWKYRGFSASAELYLRELGNLKGDGAIPRSSIFDFGGYVQCGYFVMPQKLELYTRTSQITGPLGTGSEYAGGLNYFFLPSQQNLRFTFDAAWVNHSPADQARSDYRAGDTGLLIRSQIQFFF